MNGKSKLFKGVFWLTLGDGVGQALLFLSTVLVARSLSPDQFGDFGIIRSTIYLFIAFAGMRMELAGTKFVAEFFKTDKARCGSLITIMIIITVITSLLFGFSLIIFSDDIANKIFERQDLSEYLIIGSIIIFFATNRAMLNGILNGFEAFKLISFNSIISSTIGFFAIIFLTYKFNLAGTLCGYVFHRSIYMILNFISVIALMRKQSLSFTLSHFKRDFAVLGNFILPAYISGLTVLPLKWLSESILIKQENGSYEMGLLTAALTFQMMALFPINKLHAPFLVSLASSKNDSKNLKIEDLNTNISFWLGITIFFVPMMVPEIIELFFGENYSNEKFKLLNIIIIASTIIMLFSKGVERLLTSENKIWQQSICYVVYSVSILIVSYLLIPKYGSLGIGFGYLVGSLCLTLGLFYFAYKTELLNINLIMSKRNILLLLYTIIGVSIGVVYIENILLRTLTAILFLLYSFYLYYKIPFSIIKNYRKLLMKDEN